MTLGALLTVDSLHKRGRFNGRRGPRSTSLPRTCAFRSALLGAPLGCAAMAGYMEGVRGGIMREEGLRGRPKAPQRRAQGRPCKRFHFEELVGG